MQVTDGDREPAIVGPDNVKMEAGGAADVEPRVLASIVSLILLLFSRV